MNTKLKQTFSAGLLSLAAVSGVKADTLNVQWLGASTLLFEFGDIQLITDPAFGEGEKAYKMADPNENFDVNVGPQVKYHKRLQSLPEMNPEHWDAILLSHSHEDHFDQVAQKELDKSLPIVAPRADQELLNNLGFQKQHLVDWSETWSYQENGYKVTLTALPAFHTENPDLLPLLGDGNGYWLEFEKGEYSRTVYWTGDSFVTDDVLKALKPFGKVDLFIPHIGGVGVTGPLGKIAMDANDTMVAIDAIKPSRTLPIHHSTYELFLEPVSVLMDKAVESDVRVDVTSPGAWLMVR